MSGSNWLNFIWPRHRQLPHPKVRHGGGGVALGFASDTRAASPTAQREGLAATQHWALVSDRLPTHCATCGRRLVLRQIWDESYFSEITGDPMPRYRAHFACPMWKRFVPWNEHFSHPYCPAKFGWWESYRYYVSKAGPSEENTWILTP